MASPDRQDHRIHLRTAAATEGVQKTAAAEGRVLARDHSRPAPTTSIRVPSPRQPPQAAHKNGRREEVPIVCHAPGPSSRGDWRPSDPSSRGSRRKTRPLGNPNPRLEPESAPDE